MNNWFKEVKELEERLIKFKPDFKRLSYHGCLNCTGAVIFLFDYEALLRNGLVEALFLFNFFDVAMFEVPAEVYVSEKDVLSPYNLIKT